MKEQFERYVVGIGITERPLLERIDTLLNISGNFCPEEILDMFISEIQHDDGRRDYLSLFLISDSYIMEFKKPFYVSEINWDINPIKNRVIWVDTESKFYNFETADYNSRLKADIHIPGVANLCVSMSASGLNCDKLASILKMCTSEWIAGPTNGF